MGYEVYEYFIGCLYVYEVFICFINCLHALCGCVL